MILPNLATFSGAPSSLMVPYLYSPCSCLLQRGDVAQGGAGDGAEVGDTGLTAQRAPGLRRQLVGVTQGTVDGAAQQQGEVAGGMHAGGAHGLAVTAQGGAGHFLRGHATHAATHLFDGLAGHVDQAHAAVLAAVLLQLDGGVAAMEQCIEHRGALGQQDALVLPPVGRVLRVSGWSFC